jgi:hypothetical protein
MINLPPPDSNPSPSHLKPQTSLTLFDTELQTLKAQVLPRDTRISTSGHLMRLADVYRYIYRHYDRLENILYIMHRDN